MHQPALARVVPVAAGIVVLFSGAVQFSAWKARRLACCRELPEEDCALSSDARAAWRHGLHLGIRCSLCCANLMVILLVVGVMDVQAMAVVTAFITTERLAPSGAQSHQPPASSSARWRWC